MKYKTALVTGATSGIGESLCRRLAREGLKLIITGRNEYKLSELSNNLDCVIKSIPADLILPEGREEVIAAIRAFAPDVVFNNAGFGLGGEALNYSSIEQAAIIEVNCNAVMELSLEAARTLKEKGKKGVILNVSSLAAFMIFPYSAVYAATKAFITSFSESFDMEMEPYGIRILSSNPGLVETEFAVRAGDSKDEYKGNPLTMSSDVVADEIWKQVLSLQTVRIIDWRFHLLYFISRLFPKRVLGRLLQKKIQRRIQKGP